MNESTYVMYLSDILYPSYWGFWELVIDRYSYPNIASQPELIHLLLYFINYKS